MRDLFYTVLCGLLFVIVNTLSTNVMASVPSTASVSGFQPNLGQLDPLVAFSAERDGITLFVTRNGELVHRFASSDGRDRVITERLHDAQSMQPAASAPCSRSSSRCRRPGEFTTRLLPKH